MVVLGSPIRFLAALVAPDHDEVSMGYVELERPVARLATESSQSPAEELPIWKAYSFEYGDSVTNGKDANMFDMCDAISVVGKAC